MSNKELRERLKKEQKKILAGGDGWEASNFAVMQQGRPGVDIEALQEQVIASKKKEAIYNFAVSVRGADSAKLQEAYLSKAKYASEVYNFAMSARNADVVRCTSLMLIYPIASREQFTYEYGLQKLLKRFPEVLTEEVITELRSGVTL